MLQPNSKILLFLSILSTLGALSAIPSNAQENCSNLSSLNLGGIERCLSDIQKAYESSVKATKPLESQLSGLQTQIKGIKDRVAVIEEDLAVKEKNIDNGYKNLARKETVLRSSVRDFYINSFHSSPLLIFLSLPSYSHIIQVLAIKKQQPIKIN